MATANTLVNERRAGTQKVIAKLQAERTEMLVLFCRVAGLETYSDNPRRVPAAQPVQEILQEFCQILVDYIATGHFGLYERIASGQERRRQISDLAAELYPRIAESTQIALDFNDKYDCEDHCTNLGSLQNDLSKLGEILAQRIEWEDKLIKAMVR